MHYKKALALDAQYPPPYNNIAVAYQIVGQLDAAIKIMRGFVDIQKINPEAHSNLGSFLIASNELTEAELHLKQAVELRPHYGKAWWHLGRLYFAMGDVKKSYDSFKTACTQADYDNAQGFFFRLVKPVCFAESIGRR